jgi:hypothetical protein
MAIPAWGWLLNSSSLSSQVVLQKNLPYEPVRDFAPVILLGIQPSVLVAAPSKGWKSIADLVDAAKASQRSDTHRPGKPPRTGGERLQLAANSIATSFRGPVEALPGNIRAPRFLLPADSSGAAQHQGQQGRGASSSTPTRGLPGCANGGGGRPPSRSTCLGRARIPGWYPRAIIDKLHDETRKRESAGH